VNYLASFLNRMTRDEVQHCYERFIGPYFTSDGRVDFDVARAAVDVVAAETRGRLGFRRRDVWSGADVARRERPLDRCFRGPRAD
jgi:hypothetical protein